MEEVKSLLEKNAIEIVEPQNSDAGFYSTIFIVPKQSGGFRAILNLRKLNKFIKNQHFKMETLRSVIQSLNTGDWAFSIDLSDAYLHVPIHSESRKFLRFAVEGIVYQYRVLPFGISFAPRLFTKIVSILLSHLRQRGLHPHAYLDDWLIRNQSYQQLRVEQQYIIEQTLKLGFLVNWNKSNLHLTQKLVFLGAFIDLEKGMIFPTLERYQALRDLIYLIQTSEKIQVRTFLRLLGIMNSCIDLVPWARLHMRPIQMHLLYYWKVMEKNIYLEIPVTDHVKSHLD